MKNQTISFRVEPISKLYRAFPIDMLRYDGAHPRSESESGKIADLLSYNAPIKDFKPDQLEIEIVGTHSGAPTARRWESFGWRVTDVNVDGVWEPYNAAYRAHRLVK